MNKEQICLLDFGVFKDYYERIMSRNGSLMGAVLGVYKMRAIQ